MKRSVITTGLAALIAFLPFRANTEPPKQDCVVAAARCVSVIVITVAGGIATYYVKQWCDRTFSNRNWQLTNEVDGFVASKTANSIGGPLLRYPVFSGAAGPGRATAQSCTGLGSAWVDGYSFDFTQTDGWVTVVASLNGAPVLTNSSKIVDESQPVVFDFRSLTNAPSGRFFRMMN